MSTPASPTARTRIRRLPDLAVNERDVLYAIADAGLVAHVGIETDGQPYVIPCGYARDGNDLLLHGSTGSRLFRAMASGAALCVTVTILDGLVVATSLFESSMQYRSLVVLGAGRGLSGAPKKRALNILADALLPGRRVDARPPNRRELAATTVIAVPMDEWSVKVSDGGPDVVADDAGWTPWTGVVPLALRAGVPEPAGDRPLPAYVGGWPRP